MPVLYVSVNLESRSVVSVQASLLKEWVLVVQVVPYICFEKVSKSTDRGAVRLEKEPLTWNQFYTISNSNN